MNKYRNNFSLFFWSLRLQLYRKIWIFFRFLIDDKISAFIFQIFYFVAIIIHYFKFVKRLFFAIVTIIFTNIVLITILWWILFRFWLFLRLRSSIIIFCEIVLLVTFCVWTTLIRWQKYNFLTILSFFYFYFFAFLREKFQISIRFFFRELTEFFNFVLNIILLI